MPETSDDLVSHVLRGQDRNPSLIKAHGAFGLTVSSADFQFRCDNNIATKSAIRAGIGIGPLHLGMAAFWPDVVRVLPEIEFPVLEL